MSPLATKILVAYDGSEMSEHALKKAETIARLNEAIELEILSVNKKEIHPRFFPESVYIDYTELNETIKNEVLNQLDEVKKTISLPNKVTTLLLEGDPGEEIVRYAKEKEFDLIILGNRGLNKLQEVFLGSVSHYVAQHATCPVLIVK
ncbi:nucleotide-binding universal stress UspA family protein [Pullulanibacillus pueri]|uniref:Universal stress protein n=1 Tax=Pullulanibacillus pueri TaxID=1437324 RepID=A0A8J2ZSD6_9BACL|nr:universal stress protein [Pullulanibacillus pueri]MBM7680322.1 nucleotide-binding universal stress UspA family protein [Pullulanibacillus pueri]GGH75666.1 universal stress protein YxiE [Pullulanibacillus pueri]